MDKKVLLVDGYRLTRHCMCQLIGEAGGYSVTIADDADAARECIRQNTFELILIDVSDPMKNGLETFCDLHALLPDTPVIIVNGAHEDAQRPHYVRLGCNGYLIYDIGVDDLAIAMDHALSGHPMPDHLVTALSSNGIELEVHDYEKLSCRELQIYLKLLSGKSTTRIASELSITASSVSVFKSKLFQKLSLDSHADLITYALKSNLVRFPGSLPIGH